MLWTHEKGYVGGMKALSAVETCSIEQVVVGHLVQGLSPAHVCPVAPVVLFRLTLHGTHS